MRVITFRERTFWLLVVSATLLMESVTIGCRLWYDQSASDYIATAQPTILLQLHHMFWSLPLLIVGMAARGQRLSHAMWALSGGLIASDLAHHFLVLPLWVGNTGWHWP